jgi:hypothetical protein
MPRLTPLALVVFLAAGCATPSGAQTEAASPATSAVLDAVLDEGAALTPAERAVREQIVQDGLHVVHFWAPWCDNSRAELERGWYEVIERNADVSFTFVTIWNDGEDGRDVLDRYAIPPSVTVLTQEDFGPSENKPTRRRRFLGLPVTWIPTTWVFHKHGELAYAFNYGELEMDQLQQALDGARSTWPHD